MDRQPVQSSNVKSVGYEDGVLEVEFKGGLYRYSEVPRSLFDELLDAESVGKFINDRVKPVFDFVKV